MRRAKQHAGGLSPNHSQLHSNDPVQANDRLIRHPPTSPSENVDYAEFRSNRAVAPAPTDQAPADDFEVAVEEMKAQMRAQLAAAGVSTF